MTDTTATSPLEIPPVRDTLIDRHHRVLQAAIDVISNILDNGDITGPNEIWKICETLKTSGYHQTGEWYSLAETVTAAARARANHAADHVSGDYMDAIPMTAFSRYMRDQQDARIINAVHHIVIAARATVRFDRDTTADKDPTSVDLAVACALGLVEAIRG